MINTTAKSNLDERVDFILYFQVTVTGKTKEGSQGRNLEEAETGAGGVLLACFSWFTQRPLVYNSELPTQGGTTHSGLPLPQENAEQTYVQAKLMEKVPKLRFLPPR